MKPTKLISKISKKYISITWQINSMCNYKCSYCADYYNRENITLNDYDSVINFIGQVQKKYPNKNIRLFLLGGEVVLWKHLFTFLDKLRQNVNIKVILITNCSSTVGWWNKYLKRFDFILASYHYEFSDKQHFIDVAKIINKKAFILLMMPCNEDLFLSVINIGKEISNKGKITIIPKLMRMNFEDKLYPYTKQQIKETNIINKKYSPKENLNLVGNSLISEIDKSYNSKEIFLKGYNRFQNWYCYGGIESFFIDNKGDIFVGQCKRGKFGNTIKQNYILPDEPYICDKKQCNCTVDLSSITKTKGK